ncbi:hypothetical protein [Phenylobacterium sp.]|uniref:terminase small subunit-like protein n=1 Tax=Phenylobacterium sp. TaxID=1871053 RepID=UPI002EDA2CB8
MPAPLPDRNGLKAEILRRVAAGETLKAVCASPGMPRPRTVYGWTWTDASFDDALAEALRKGEWLRHRAFDEDKARAFLARLAAGEPLTQLVNEPAMPNELTLRHWRMEQGQFGAEVRRLVRMHQVARGVARGQARLARYRPWNEAEGDRVLVRVGRGEPIPGLCRGDPGLPEPWLIERWRRESPEFAHDLALHIQTGRRKRPSRHAARRREAVVEALMMAILRGGTFNSLQGRNGFPTRRTLGRWVRKDPEFAKAVARACRDREDALLAAQLDILDRAGSLPMRSLRRLLAPLRRRVASLRTRPGFRRSRRG